ncbi:MAG: ATP-binding protein [Clostridium sp.]|nr:ATP-binding protein [Clostridium sp.]
MLPIHINLENKISTMVRRGYLARNPVEHTYFKKLEILNDMKNNKNISTDDIDFKMKFMRSTADCLTILGISGIGKTTAIERLLLMYPQVIKHNVYKNKHFTRTQIVWLKIDCPYDGSLATLCKSFFKAIDSILGTKYFEKYGYYSRITSTMMLSMTQLASMYGIGILVIDEIQQLINSKNNIDEMLNFFVTLSNTVGIPTILIGTPKAQEIFKGNFRQARRASSDGFILWDRMKKDSTEWDILVKTLWEMQCLQEYSDLTSKMVDELYDKTQGITSVVINLFLLVQERALAKGSEKITVELIRESSEKDLQILQPMLKAIRSNNLKEVAKYDDITIDFDSVSNNIYNNIELSNRMEQIYNETKKDIETKRKNRTEDLFIELKLLKVAPKLTDDELMSVISKEVDTNPVNMEYDELKGKCIRNVIIKNDKTSIKTAREGSIYHYDKGSLLDIYNNANCKKVHTYELLKQNGYIKNPIEELIC